MKICKNCEGKIRRIRAPDADPRFCSTDCKLKFNEKLRLLIKVKEKELKKLKEEKDKYHFAK